MLCSLPGARGQSAQVLAQKLSENSLLAVDALGKPARFSCYESPAAAFAAARGQAQDNDRIVVFGSFLTVADVLAGRG
jgi:dihydrofolate synthase/folylpolyglutamate synthase